MTTNSTNESGVVRSSPRALDVGARTVDSVHTAGGHAPLELEPRVPPRTRWLQRPIAGRHDDRDVGAHLDRTIETIGAVLHGVKIPGTDLELTHVVVAPSGIWLIETLTVQGRVERTSMWGDAARLVIDGVDRHDLLDGQPALQAAVDWLVKSGLDAVPVHRVLCLIDAHWSLSAHPFEVDGMLVAWPRGLSDKIVGSGLLPVARARAIAGEIADRSLAAV